MNKKIIIIALFISMVSLAKLCHARSGQSEYHRNLFSGEQTMINEEQAQSFFDEKLLNWIRARVSADTKLPLSFHVPDPIKKHAFENMGASDSAEGIIERTITKEGLVIYDGAVAQIVRTFIGTKEDLDAAQLPIKAYWQGSLKDLSSIRAGFPINNFIYDPQNPEAVSSDLSQKGSRGFIFRIINAHGRYLMQDPLDGKTHLDSFPTWPRIHWEDWKPVAGENAWVAMAALHLHVKKYLSSPIVDAKNDDDRIELKLAEELARSALLLQADNGGIRMAPIGVYMPGRSDGRGWYELISTENNLSWYAAFRMLYQVTQNPIYQEALEKMENYFQSVWNFEEEIFDQGMRYDKGSWAATNEYFATDVQTWGILVLGCEKIDSWFGFGTAYRMWQRVKEYAGSYGLDGELLGVGFTKEQDRVSVEWTAGAIMAARDIAQHYQTFESVWSQSALTDAAQMRQGIESWRQDLPHDQAAYSYSSKRGWIPFGWFSHSPEVLSMASTAWVVLVDANVNPFRLLKNAHVQQLQYVAQVLE